MDFGHWSILDKDIDINDYLAFVYVIIFKNGKKYVGVKKLWKKIKTPPNSYKRSRIFEESDWKSYTSSSAQVNEMIESGEPIDDFIIVGWFDSWGKALLGELQMQLSNDVLTSDDWLNSQAGGHFNAGCIDGSISTMISNWMNLNNYKKVPVYKVGHVTKFIVSPELDKYINNGWAIGQVTSLKVEKYKFRCELEIFDLENNKSVMIRDLVEFCRSNKILISDVDKLVAGKIDDIDLKWSLPISIRRRPEDSYIFKDGTCIFKSDLHTKYNVASFRHCSKFIKADRPKLIKRESRAEYVKRLSYLKLKTFKPV